MLALARALLSSLFKRFDRPQKRTDDMTLHTATSTREFTETELQSLSLRFEIRGDYAGRRFYVDGIEVSEAEYVRAFEGATGQNISRLQ